jgi:putative heme-binding domain-containing protein
MERALLLGAWLLACACARPSVAAELVNPFEGDEAAARFGSALYAGRCADCHGADVKGSRGPDLTLRFAAGTSDESVFMTVRRGVAGSIMPPSSAPDNELWAVVAYLRSISVVPPLASSGDPARGRALFVAECAQCHRVGVVGGTLGPELTRIGAARSREALVAAIREPSVAVALGFRAVTLRTKTGERVAGVVKSEDAFSLQVLTTDGQLRGYRKAALTAITADAESLMPQFGDERLDAGQLEDLLAYLGTLRTP